MRSLTLTVSLVLSPAALGQVPNKLGYQGRILKSDGTPETGIVAMTFAVFDAASGGSALGCDAMQVALSDGFYSVLLGGIGGCVNGPPAIIPSIFDGKPLYLEVGLGGSLFAPRQTVSSVAYALRAGTAANVRGGSVEATSVTVGGPTGVSVSATGISVGNTPTVDSSGKATVATGAGLTGTGSTASPLAVVYGTAAGTAAEGNDPRLSDARTPTPGSSDYVQNLATTAAAQSASLNISGSAAIGNTLAIGATAAAAGTRLHVQGAARFGANANQSALAALNVSSGENAATLYRDIDMHGAWAGGEGHAITATHAVGATNIVGQIVFHHDNPGSRIRFGRLYHAGDQTTYPIEIVSTGANADLTIAAGSNLVARGAAQVGGNTNQQLLAALNVSSGQGAVNLYRDIDMHGEWVGGEGHAITATHAVGATNIVGQIVFQHDSPGSRIRFGRLHHAGDQTTYPLEHVQSL